eukprot:tig00001033_g6497.t1
MLTIRLARTAQGSQAPVDPHRAADLKMGHTMLVMFAGSFGVLIALGLLSWIGCLVYRYTNKNKPSAQMQARRQIVDNDDLKENFLGGWINSTEDAKPGKQAFAMADSAGACGGGGCC